MTKFSKIIDEYDDGRLNEQLSELWQRVVDACNVYGNPGEMTIKLAVKKDGDRAIVHPKIAVKIPTESPVPTMWWFDDNGEGLHRENPLQMKLRALAPQEQHNPQPETTEDEDDE